MTRAGPLPRRAWLGLELGPELSVSALDEGGPAARAGIEAGDVLVASDGAPLVDAADLVRRLRAEPNDAEILIRFRRHGVEMDRRVRWTPLPIETLAEGVVELGEVRAEDHRLRTILGRPRDRSHDARTAVLVLQGLDCVSCEHPLDANHPLRVLVDAWTRAGIVVMRVERSGVGDSEGPPCRETSLDAELATQRAALDALLARDDVDRSRIFLFGSSFGGMIAPLLARERAVAGIVVFGTSARAWDDCVVQTMVRQRKLSGTANPELAAFVARWAELVALIVREGWTPEEAFDELPRLRSCRSRDAEGRTLFGRDVALFQRLVENDLVEAWRAVTSPVLVLHGEHDWVSSREEAREVADAARATFVELQGIAHDLRSYETLEESFTRRGSGRANDRVARAAIDWIRSIKRA